MANARDQFLAHASSDESDNESGYDSEAAEISKSTKRSAENVRPTKRRKLSHSSADSDEDSDASDVRLTSEKRPQAQKKKVEAHTAHAAHSESDEAPSKQKPTSIKANKQSTRDTAPTTLPAIHNGPDLSSNHHFPPPTSHPKKPKSKAKPSRPGVIYLSSLPPYLRPSALRNLLQQRGFGPISRLFLTPASKSTSSSRTPSSSSAKSSSSSSRKLYTEGWLEFPSHTLAKLCATTLNATPIGGKKGGYYRDDLWNMKYLRGMAWGELMAGVAGERREEEAKRDEERREIARGQKMFVEGVERGRRWETGERRERERKRKRKDEGGAAGEKKDEGEGGKVERTWRQFEIKKGGGSRGKAGGGEGDEIGREAREVLGKIF